MQLYEEVLGRINNSGTSDGVKKAWESRRSNFAAARRAAWDATHKSAQYQDERFDPTDLLAGSREQHRDMHELELDAAKKHAIAADEAEKLAKTQDQSSPRGRWISQLSSGAAENHRSFQKIHESNAESHKRISDSQK